MKDEIIEEVWKAKDAIAAKYNYDIRALGAALQASEKKSKAKFVNLHARRASALHHAH